VPSTPLAGEAVTASVPSLPDMSIAMVYVVGGVGGVGGVGVGVGVGFGVGLIVAELELEISEDDEEISMLLLLPSEDDDEKPLPLDDKRGSSDSRIWLAGKTMVSVPSPTQPWKMVAKTASGKTKKCFFIDSALPARVLGEVRVRGVRAVWAF